MASSSSDQNLSDSINALVLSVRSIKRARTRPGRLKAEAQAEVVLARVRRVLLDDALASGMTQADVARARGVSKQAVNAEVKRNRLADLEAALMQPAGDLPVQNTPGRRARRWSWRHFLRR